MTTRRLALHALASVTAMTVAPSLAIAQGLGDFPSKPIRYIVPFPPGGLTDVMARMIAVNVGAAFKQSVVVDNRAGASANLGADLAAKATPAVNAAWMMVWPSSKGISSSSRKKLLVS